MNNVPVTAETTIRSFRENLHKQRSQPVRETRTRGAMNENLKSKALLGVFSDAGYIDVGTKVRDPSAPRSTRAVPPFPPSLVNPFQAPRQPTLTPEPTGLTSLSPPRSTGQAPALPHQGNPPSEISRQAVRRQPAEDRLLRRQGASPPPPIPRFDFPKWHKKIALFSPFPTLTRLFPPIVPSAPRGLPR